MPAKQTVNDSVVKLQDVYKVYQKGEFTINALNGISLDVHDGEYLAIMGSSGSGKSTLLNILGCLDQPSEGSYFLENEDVSTLEDNALSRIRSQRIGFVFQSFNLIEQLNVLENIQVPLFYQQVDPDESYERSKHLAERVGLGERLDHRPSELSGGQMQRVAIARALANDPNVILADEPTGNLDSKTENEVLAIIEELNDQGKTIIMVTHEASVGDRARRVIHLKDGLIDREVVNA